MNNDLLEIGRICKPHGVHGKAEIVYYGESPEILASSPYVLAKKNGERHTLKVQRITAHKKRCIVEFDLVSTFQQVQALVGSTLYIPRSALPPLAEDEFYWFDLIGCRVLTTDGTVVGIVSRVLPTGSNDVYVVAHEKGEVLIPATFDAINSIDTQAKTIVINSIEGLLDNDFI
ncbi:MAG TPA: ribosome maturation factor RimM [Thermodesulfobacteriota bacterium]|nr:16S rRNA processing protein RimM [Deltaproteobacteria bacterium]HNU71650.1 ribosome maturation factor RimM [Thermodesulfobacteriota bacterium]HOC37654.1 ribosome maturation factor RimM [Thermodesulfobacteriota bacterium]HQO77662.1 ribosome maturation factor RimM [Thermodesulfobacteriota bacterium]